MHTLDLGKCSARKRSNMSACTSVRRILTRCAAEIGSRRSILSASHRCSSLHFIPPT